MNLTAAQIVAQACAIAKCPGYLVLGGQQLNLTLDDLVMHRNLKVNLIVSTIVAQVNSNGPFPMEPDYKRTYDLSYLIDGTPYFLNPCSLKQYDMEDKQSGQFGYPYEWASDLSAVATGGVGQMFIYPASNTQLSMQHRYFLDQPLIVTPETSVAIPWFEDQDYLIQSTAMRLMRITDDMRYDKWVMDAENMIRQHLLTEGDEQQVVKSVQLDPRRFKVGGSMRPTKLNPY